MVFVRTSVLVMHDNRYPRPSTDVLTSALLQHQTWGGIASTIACLSPTGVILAFRSLAAAKASADSWALIFRNLVLPTTVSSSMDLIFSLAIGYTFSTPVSEWIRMSTMWSQFARACLSRLSNSTIILSNSWVKISMLPHCKHSC